MADTAGFERRLSVELPSLAGSFAWRNLRTDFELYYELSAEVNGLGFGSSAVAAINDPLRF